MLDGDFYNLLILLKEYCLSQEMKIYVKKVGIAAYKC